MNINWRRVASVVALVLVVVAIGWYLLGRRAPTYTPATDTPAAPTPAVAELEQATAIIEAADAHRKVLGCDDCSTRVEAVVREAELQRLRKENEELKVAKPAAPTPAQRAVVDINIRQQPFPPLPPPARNPCEPADPCYRRQPY